MSIKKEIVQRINDFIEKRDVSIQNANAIEVILIDEYAEDEELQEVALMLASYRPEGGDYLYNTVDMINRLKKILLKI